MKNNDFSYSSFSYYVVTSKTICRQDQKVSMLLFSIYIIIHIEKCILKKMLCYLHNAIK